MTVGLIRTEAAGDLRTLTATGATSTTRRTLTAATAGAFFLGALPGAHRRGLRDRELPRRECPRPRGEDAFRWAARAWATGLGGASECSAGPSATNGAACQWRCLQWRRGMIPEIVPGTLVLLSLDRCPALATVSDPVTAPDWPALLFVNDEPGLPDWVCRFFGFTVRTEPQGLRVGFVALPGTRADAAGVRAGPVASVSGSWRSGAARRTFSTAGRPVSRVESV